MDAVLFFRSWNISSKVRKFVRECASITLSAVLLTVLMTLLAHSQLSSLLFPPRYLTTCLSVYPL